jgi:hypothetical protein
VHVINVGVRHKDKVGGGRTRRIQQDAAPSLLDKDTVAADNHRLGHTATAETIPTIWAISI